MRWPCVAWRSWSNIADQPMDFADASLVVLAETLGDLRIVTFDRGFHAFRTWAGAAFDVLDGLRCVIQATPLDVEGGSPP